MNQTALIVSDNPLVLPPKPTTAAAGVTIASLCPDVRTPVVCRYNGMWILRKDWQRTTRPGDVVEFHVRPAGKGALRSLLTIAVMIVAITIIGPYFGPPGSFAFIAAVTATNTIGQALINTLVPLTSNAAGGGMETSPTYNISLQGNQARLDAPIPVLYGYNKTYPNFAGQPYVHHDSKDDQYYHALLVIGHGDFQIIRTLIDDTVIEHFSDVKYRILPPGTLPSAMTLPSGYTTTVKANMVTAEEVTGLDMLTNSTLGPFAACAPKQKASVVHLDIGAPALGISSGGGMSNRTVQWRVDYREVDDFGLATGEYVSLGTESLTAASASAVRRTYTYAIPIAARVEVAVTRLDTKSDSADNYDDLSWFGLRSEITDPAPLCSTATHLQVVIRANEQLSSMSQRKIAVTSIRKLRVWSPVSGWSTTVPTRSPAWALADKWTNSVYGDALTDARCDLQGLYEKSLVWDARQDRFDYVFDTDMSSNDADQLIAKAGRAAVFSWYGVRTLARDEADPLPARAFTGRNIGEDSWSFSYTMPSRDMPDGLIVEYLDNRSWKPTYIESPMPGAGLPMTNPQRIKLQGVTGEKQVRREAAYYAAALLYRRGTAKWTTEMEGAMLTYNAAVRYAPPMPDWATGGDVVSWDPGTLTATVTEPVATATGAVLFVDDLGKATSPIAFTRVDDHTITLASAPPVGLSFNSANRERTRYLLGAVSEVDRVVRVRRVEPAMREFGQPRNFNITAVVEDSRVHTADAAFLPVGSVVQDPIDDGTTSVSSSVSGLGLVSISDALIGYSGYGSPNPGARAGLRLLPTGGMRRVGGDVTVGVTDTAVANQWLIGSSTDAFEVYAQLASGAISGASVASSATDTWLPLSTEQAWYVGGATASATLVVSIRKVGGVVQDTATFTLTTENYDPGGGF